MDTRFSSAIHTLILISEAETPMTSEEIAVSVGTNASYIRKITSLMKKAGIIESRQGKSGFALLIPPAELTLYEIYKAIYESDQVHVFDIHRNPNDECIVGRHIQPVLEDMFREIEERTEQQLRSETLAGCMKKLGKEIDRSK